MALSFMMSKYRVLGKKGEGTFSEVLKCQDIKDGTFLACKKMKHQYESLDQVNNLREVQAMRRLSPHPNILPLMEVIFDKKSGTLVLICELMDQNIYELIRGRRYYLSEKRIRLLIYQLLRSIDHMHRNGIFHRDIKPENILIKDDRLKLADFGSCRSVYSKQPFTEYISTRWYRAPECLLTDGYYTYKMDIWSVGCVFFEVMSLHPLFPGANEVDQIAKIHDIMGTPDSAIISKLRKYDTKTRGMNFNFPTKKGTGITKLIPHATSECIDLIHKMCTYDPDDRISAKQALKHIYFKELRDAEKRAAAVAKAQKKLDAGGDAEDPETPDVPLSTRRLDNTDAGTAAAAAAEKRRLEKKIQKREREKDGSLPPRDNKLPKESSPDRDQDKENRSPGGAGSEAGTEQGDGASPRIGRGVAGEESSGVGAGGGSHKTNGPRVPGSILHNRDPVYQYHRRDRRKRRQKARMTESGPSPTHNSTFFPKVTHPKPSSFQPSFHTSTYTGSHNQAYNTTGNALPKLSMSNASTTHATTSTTYLPSLTQAFTKTTKPAKNIQASKNMYGHYQLPSIERRGAGY